MKPLRTFTPCTVANAVAVVSKTYSKDPRADETASQLVSEYWSEYERATWGRGA